MGYLPKPLLQQEEWFRNIAGDPDRFIFAMCLSASDEHIGNAALGCIDYIHRNAMLSLFIYDHRHRRHGYGREAVAMLLDFAFNRLNLHKVFLRTSPEYEGAKELYESLGFVHEGTLRAHEFKFGRYRDKLLFGLLRDEYCGASQGTNGGRSDG